ncbi:18679_t:CDS:2 [Gigaspora margarita]|uniref:18679_t:CDS:1 n=1 Tax=Gigaspora margarita TaxID=4874 RepID=A0ABN7V0T7_GIGMA|nr:18679_t:CDS:2 [Gigaspora margarita]
MAKKETTQSQQRLPGNDKLSPPKECLKQKRKLVANTRNIKRKKQDFLKKEKKGKKNSPENDANS